MAKTLYHSTLKSQGPTRVTVKSDVLKSKYPGKPDYVMLTINGEDFNYSTENATCADFFRGQKGRTFTVQAEGGGKGSEDSAVIVYLGEPGTEIEQPAAPPAAAKPPTPPPQRKSSMAPHNTAVPPGHPEHKQHPAAAAPAPPPRPVGQKTPRNGAMVGACINKAADYMIAEGVLYSATELANRASDLVRIAEWLESGHNAPTFSERQQKQKGAE